MVNVQSVQTEKMELLKGWLESKQHKEIFGLVTSVAKSGMSRKAKFYIIKNESLYNVTYHVAEILGYSVNESGEIRLGGCGMNMIDWAVMRVSDSLYGDSYKIQSRYI
jgi:hypothetical protein